MVPMLLDHFLARHADAVVGDGDGARRLVEGDADLQFGIAFEQRVVGQRLEAQLVAASEALEISSRRKISLLLYKEWIISLQQLFDFGLEAQGFFVCLLRSCYISHWIKFVEG